ncbi:MAG: transglutaminase-like domain-containing protein [Ferruginibacter sp.]
MRKRCGLLLSSIILLQFAVSAFVKDSNVVISNSKEFYTFNFNKKDNRVVVNQNLTTTYQCREYRTTVGISEFYDDKTTIDDVGIIVSGSKSKYITPRYEYYSVNDIFYSDAHICYFNLPLEKRGSTSEVNFEKTITDPRYFTSIYFSDNYNIENKVVSITVPRWMKVDFKEFNFEGREIKKTTEYDSKKDADIITYTIKKLAERVSENYSPGGTYTEPHLLILCKNANLQDGNQTYLGSLNDLYGWYRSLTKNLENNTAVIKTKADEITAGASNNVEKIKKIFYWMQDNIRYVAFEDGLAGFRPAKADDVLKKKYGDCKGMAHLTKELLKSQGFDARLCWIGTNHIAYDYSTPSIAVDNHMICALLFEGKTYFLDATENFIGFNEYAERIQGRQVLIEDGDKYIFTKVPVTTYLQNMDAEKSILLLNGKDMEGAITREWKGEEKEHIFTQLNAIKKENTNEAFIKYLSDNNKDYIVSEFKTSSLSDYDKPLNVQYKMKHANAVSGFGSDLYVDIDFRKDLSDFTFDIKERVHDFWFSYKINSQRDIELAIPDGYSVTSMPGNVFIKNDDYEMTTALSKTATKILYSKKIIIKNTKLTKEKFPQWNKDIEKLNAFYNEQIVLSKK